MDDFLGGAVDVSSRIRAVFRPVYEGFRGSKLRIDFWVGDATVWVGDATEWRSARAIDDLLYENPNNHPRRQGPQGPP